MIDVYVDESIHDRAGFIVTSLVFAPAAASGLVAAEIWDATRRAKVDEHKSSNRMDTVPERRALRGRLFQVMRDHGCRVATAVSTRAERHLIADHVGQLIEEMVASSRINHNLNIHFDEGIKTPSNWKTTSKTILHFGQRSSAVPGIQLADLAAHTTATMLLCELGLVTKKIRAGENSGYDPNEMLDLEFELWASLRYCLASDERCHAPGEQTETNFADHKPFGLLVSAYCDASLRKAAENQLGSVWLGCIH